MFYQLGAVSPARAGCQEPAALNLQIEVRAKRNDEEVSSVDAVLPMACFKYVSLLLHVVKRR